MAVTNSAGRASLAVPPRARTGAGPEVVALPGATTIDRQGPNSPGTNSTSSWLGSRTAPTAGAWTVISVGDPVGAGGLVTRRSLLAAASQSWTVARGAAATVGTPVQRRSGIM